jgi:integrase
VPLPACAREALGRHRSAWKVAPLPTALAFTTGRGSPMRASSGLRRDFADLCTAAGHTECTMHTLRHTAAGHLVANGRAVVDPHVAEAVERLNAW